MATYYVRKDGNDGNGGTDPDTDAWLTISQAEAGSTTSDTINVGAGDWNEDCDLDRDYVGQGMFTTSISAIDANPTGGATLQNIKLIWASYAQDDLRWPVTATNVYFDWSNIGGNFSYDMFYTGGAITLTRCVFRGTANATGAMFRITSTNTLTIDHCTFYDVYGNNNIIQLDNANGDAEVTNSIFYSPSCTASPNVMGGAGTPSLERNNLYYYPNATLDSTGIDASSITGQDPLFEDAAGGDFRLAADSPCINKGQD